MKKLIFLLINILIFNFSYSQEDFNTFHRVSKNIPGLKNVKVRIYGDFSISYQNLKHESALNNSMGHDSLPSLAGGFNNAQGNLGFIFDLYDGITIDILMNLSTYHHTEAFMREGWIKVDKLTMLNSDFVDKIMEYVTIKAGQMEINYGDWHLRRSNSGAAFNNPLVGNYIVDANTTEIAFEVYVKYSDWLAMIAFSDGNTTGVLEPDWNLSLYGKLAWDKEINEDLRLRLSGSVYRSNHENTSTATVLYRGNRSGARYRG